MTYNPLGVIGNISAWNYPYFIGVNVFIPALLCGSITYKSSEICPLSGIRIASLLKEAGLPDHIFSNLTGADVGTYIAN